MPVDDHLPAITGGSDIRMALSQKGVNLLPAFLHRFDRIQTRRAYRNDLVQFFQSSDITPSMAQAVTFMHVNEHINQLELGGSKSTTIKRRISALRGFFSWLEALEVISRNPTKKELLRRVRSVSAGSKAIVFLSAEQADRLVEATNDAGEASVRNRALILTLLHCVLRRSEAAGMNVDHLRPLGKYWILDLPLAKGGADQYVKVPEHIVEEIELVQHTYGVSTGPIWRSLSNNSRGRRLSSNSIYEIVRNTAAAANLEVEIGAHTLRHTGCTLAIEGGASLQQVKDHARHKNVETTMTYVHQRDRLRDSAADFISIKKKSK